MKPNCTLPMTQSARATGGLLTAMLMLAVSEPSLVAAEMPVSAVQETLKREQFFYGDASGVLDEPTRAALRRYQIRYGLPVSGEIDAATLAVLKAPRDKDAMSAPATPVAPAAAPKAPAAAVEKDREFLQDLQQSESAPGKMQAAPPATTGVGSTRAASSTSTSNLNSRAAETTEQDFVGTGTARIISRRGPIEGDPVEPAPRPPLQGEVTRQVTRTTTTTTGSGIVETDDDVDPLAPNGARIIRPRAPGAVPAPDGQVVVEKRTTTPATGSPATPTQARTTSPGSGLPIYPQADEPPSRLVPEAPPRKPQGFFQRLFRGDR